MNLSNSEPIAIVGNLNLDIKTSVIPAGEAILRDGETSVEEVYETTGGGGANTAVAAAALGGQVHFWGAIGADALGERLEAHLRSLGITPHLAPKPFPTGRSINLVWDNHQRHFVSSLPHCRELEPEDVDVESLAAAGCRELYRADVWFAPKMLDSGNEQLLRQARAAGMKTAIDINWDPEWSRSRSDPLVQERLRCVRRLMPLLDAVHGNERELCFFTGLEHAAEAARALVSEGAGMVILHRGPAGSAALTSGGEWIEASAVPVPRVVSETGTGDVFTAAFLLLGHLPLPERLAGCSKIAASHLSGERQFIPRLER